MEPIAIIGLGCRFPSASDPQAYWQLLRNGIDGITEVPSERWDIDALYDETPATPGKMNTRWGGFLKQVDRFDADFFRISPREAESIDPQQRLLLEVAWEALENGGLVPEKLANSQTGVFVGISNNDYGRTSLHDLTTISAYSGTGNALCIAANRLSYLLNFKGPSLAIDTACSSSLVAVHYACQSLRLQEADLCLAGGVNLILSPEATITFSQARMMASDGHCKTFDAKADGYVRGEGCGMVVLKRLSDALKDGNQIYAVIKGSAVNQDGLTNGLTAPNGPSQQAVIRQALKNAGVKAKQISYVEAHGTGTPLGDPQEFNSLKKVLMEDRQPDQPCWIGSVKTNIGHLESASGVAGLIKVILSLQHQEIPPHLHLQQLNPYISLEGTPFRIPQQCEAWETAESKRLAGISGFGFGGTNCHLIVEEAPIEGGRRQSLLEGGGKEEGIVERPYHLLTLSAKSEPTLLEMAQRYQTFLVSYPDVSVADVCFSANTGRSHFDHRLAIVIETSEDLQQQLTAFANHRESTAIAGTVKSRKLPKIAFLFTGQGSQHENMGRQLYETQPVFRQTLEQCDQILGAYLDKPLLEILYPAEGQSSAIHETAYTQPALFALEYALAQLWQSWGIKPDVVMGHSVGEYVAACVAGVFSLDDGLKLIAHRGRLMQQLPSGGKMLSLMATETQIREVLDSYKSQVTIAAFNGPQSIVISGEGRAIEAIQQAVESQGIKTKLLNVSHAFHSPLMEPMLAEFEAIAQGITYHQPEIPLISNLTGEQADEAIATSAYWVNHVCQPVRFAQSMKTLHQQGAATFLEIGSKPILLGMGRQCLPENIGVWLPSLRPPQTDWQQILHSLGQLFVQGIEIDWQGFDQDYARHQISLPTYPFQRKRYWLETEKAEVTSPGLQLLSQGQTEQLIEKLEQTGNLSLAERQLLPKLIKLLTEQPKEEITPTWQNWLYEVEWMPKAYSPSLSSYQNPKQWLILADQQGIAEQLATLIRSQGDVCTLVYIGEQYQQIAPEAFSLNPEDSGSLQRLIEQITAQKIALAEIVHCWSLPKDYQQEISCSDLTTLSQLSCGTTLSLVQALLKARLPQTPRLWLVTQGIPGLTQTDPEIAGIPQASLWGMGKVIALEHPELNCVRVDLDSNQTIAEQAEALFLEMESEDDEDQIAFREGQRYVPRLVHWKNRQLQKQSLTFGKDKTYLITGGTGGLGLQVAHWLVKKGAKHLVLVGRRPPRESVQSQLKQLEQAGAVLTIEQADVSDFQFIKQVLSKIQQSSVPLSGVIHAAGVLDDGVLQQQTWPRFLKVMQPKVQGAWNLHQLTQDQPLDFFMLFSSAASLLGSLGQGNYCAANAFLDSLAHYRRAMGLAGLSINWGTISQIGLAAERQADTKMKQKGIQAITPEQVLQVLETLMPSSAPEVGVVPIDWSVGLSNYIESPFLEKLVREAESTETRPQTLSFQTPEILQQLQQKSASDRSSFLTTYIQNNVAKGLGISPAQLDLHQPLINLGIDSLMAIELRNRVRKELEMDIPIVKLMEDGNVMSITTYLYEQLTDRLQADAETTAELNDKTEVLAIGSTKQDKSVVNRDDWIEGEL